MSSPSLRNAATGRNQKPSLAEHAEDAEKDSRPGFQVLGFKIQTLRALRLCELNFPRFHGYQVPISEMQGQDGTKKTVSHGVRGGRREGFKAQVSSLRIQDPNSASSASLRETAFPCLVVVRFSLASSASSVVKVCRMLILWFLNPRGYRRYEGLGPAGQMPRK